MQSRGVPLKQGPMIATPAAQTVSQPGAAVEITDSPRIKAIRLRTVLGLAMKEGRRRARIAGKWVRFKSGSGRLNSTGLTWRCCQSQYLKQNTATSSGSPRWWMHETTTAWTIALGSIQVWQNIWSWTMG